MAMVCYGVARTDRSQTGEQRGYVIVETHLLVCTSQPNNILLLSGNRVFRLE
jgi:hypothetical protein